MINVREVLYIYKYLGQINYLWCWLLREQQIENVILEACTVQLQYDSVRLNIDLISMFNLTESCSE